MLDVINLDFDYQEHSVLSQVTFHVPFGGMVHLKGANGSGKTTLLKLIAGLYQPVEGEIRFCGNNINDDLLLYKQQICYVGHKTGINPSLSLKENCFFDVHYHKQNLEELVDVFQLGRYLDTPCGLLSAGQRRQAGLLRLWMSEAKLWLLDEPLVALDDKALELIISKIAFQRKRGGAVLLTSHQTLPLRKSDYLEHCL